MKTIFWTSTKALNVGLFDHVEEGLRIVTLLGVVFVTSRVHLREIPQFLYLPHCMYVLHLRLIHWTSVGPHSLSMRLEVVVAIALMAFMSNQTPNCYQPHMNLQQRSDLPFRRRWVIK